MSFNLAPNQKQSMLSIKNIFISGVSMAGILVFLSLVNFHQQIAMFKNDWTHYIPIIISTVLLEFFMFKIPPKGNNQSMDSAIFLACLFSFGLSYSLIILFVGTLIYGIFETETAKWKHIINFSIYSFMLWGAGLTFKLLGGETGILHVTHLFAYIAAILIYFIINVILVALFFWVSMRANFFGLLSGILKECISGCIIGMLMSLVLNILYVDFKIFGIILFTIISLLLSLAFSQLFKLYNEVSEKAVKDQRTGLFNHGYFEASLEEQVIAARQTGEPLSLSLLDLDNFKKYNDTFGHLKGDKLLEFFGGLLKRECEAQGFLAARYGGEEFTILFPHTDEKDAYSFVNKLRKQVNDTFFEGVDVFPHRCLSFSAGIVGYNNDMLDKADLVDKADKAMYFAKAQGKNMVHLYDDDSIIQKTQDLEQEIQEIDNQLRIFLSKDVYTYQHSRRVFEYAVEMAEKLKLKDYERKVLVLGALFHDIGKLEVPREVLNKKGKLTHEEWKTIQMHVTWGKEIAQSNHRLRDMLPIIELHHERYDGKGYPYGLKEQQIPKLARIMTVIDSFDAMTTERPYQPTKSFDEAFEELITFSGKQFDPLYVEPFIEMVRDKFYNKRETKLADSVV